MKIIALLFFVGFVTGQLTPLPLGPGITAYSHDIFLFLLFIVFVISHRKKRLPKPQLFVPAAAFVLSGVLSLLVNLGRFPLPEVISGSLYLLRWVFYASFYWIVVESALASSFWLWGLYASGVALAGLGLVQYAWYPYLRNLSYLGWDPHLYRVFSTVLDPNFAGILFVLTIFLGLSLWQEKKYRAVVLIGQGVTLLAFFLTFSRSSYLAFFVGLSIFLSQTKRIKVLIPLVAAFVIGVVLLPKPDGEGVRLFRTVSTFARFGNWERGVELIREAPLFGYGFNTLRFVQRAKGWVDDSAMVSKAGAGLDNSFEFIWATTGIVGVSAYLWLMWRILGLGKKARNQKSTHILGSAYTASLGAIIIHSMFSNSLFYPWVMLWFWGLTGSLELIISRR